ncbi:MAG: hypothetical protein WDO14_01475 [Bacteroidota bacterium]
MKKPLFVLAAIVAMSCKPSIETEVQTGRVVDNRYINESIDVCFTFPEGTYPMTLIDNRMVDFDKKEESEVDIDDSETETVVIVGGGPEDIFVQVINPNKLEGSNCVTIVDAKPPHEKYVEYLESYYTKTKEVIVHYEHISQKPIDTVGVAMLKGILGGCN